MKTRNAFTLIELLIVMFILLILAGLTVAAYSSLTGGDKMRAASRQLQSAILGARDRAIHAGNVRGVRLMPDSAMPGTVSAIAYVGAPEQYTAGFVELWRDTNGEVKVVKQFVPTEPGHPRTGWNALKTAGLLTDGARIRLPGRTGSWYTVDTSQLTAASETLVLRMRHRTAPVIAGTGVATNPMDYSLELQPRILAGEQPMTLPSGCGIDLKFSRGLPAGPLDILFSGKGVPTASRNVHLLLAELGDIEAGLDPSKREGEMKVVSLRGASGAVTSHEADPTDSNSDGKADNVFGFAETGMSAGK